MAGKRVRYFVMLLLLSQAPPRPTSPPPLHAALLRAPPRARPPSPRLPSPGRPLPAPPQPRSPPPEPAAALSLTTRARGRPLPPVLDAGQLDPLRPRTPAPRRPLQRCPARAACRTPAAAAPAHARPPPRREEGEAGPPSEIVSNIRLLDIEFVRNKKHLVDIYWSLWLRPQKRSCSIHLLPCFKNF